MLIVKFGNTAEYLFSVPIPIKCHRIFDFWQIAKKVIVKGIGHQKYPTHVHCSQIAKKSNSLYQSQIIILCMKFG